MPKHPILIAAAALATCVPLSAQEQSHGTPIAGSGCPIAFSASRDGALIARAELPNVRPENAGVRVNVHFAPESVGRIVEVSGSVYGITAAPHLKRLNADTIDNAGPRLRSQAFHLTGFHPDSTTLDWNLDVISVPVLQDVALSEIRFSNGIVWRESAAAHCRVNVSGLLRVGAAR